MSIPEGITPEMIEELVNSPGKTISAPSPANAATSSRPTTSHAINAGQANVRPQIGGHVNGKEKITVSSHLAKRLDDGDKKMKAEAKAQLDSIRAREEEVSPDSILGRLGYLERKLKQANVEINKLKKICNG